MITSLVTTIPIAPLYLLTTDYTMIVAFFTLQGFFGGGGMHTQWPHYLFERFPTEVRATATGFCYHQGAIFGGLTMNEIDSDSGSRKIARKAVSKRTCRSITTASKTPSPSTDRRPRAKA
jgi:hypothetical protein